MNDSMIQCCQSRNYQLCVCLTKITESNETTKGFELS